MKFNLFFLEAWLIVFVIMFILRSFWFGKCLGTSCKIPFGRGHIPGFISQDNLKVGNIIIRDQVNQCFWLFSFLISIVVVEFYMLQLVAPTLHIKSVYGVTHVCVNVLYIVYVSASVFNSTSTMFGPAAIYWDYKGRITGIFSNAFWWDTWTWIPRYFSWTSHTSVVTYHISQIL
jgi:hypothetical protein